MQRISLMPGHHHKPANLCHLYKCTSAGKQIFRFDSLTGRACDAAADPPAGDAPNRRYGIHTSVAAVGYGNFYYLRHCMEPAYTFFSVAGRF